MVDNESKSAAAASLFTSENVDIVCVFISTYALSSTVLPVVQRVGRPVLLLNIQPDDFWHDLLNDTRIIRHGAKVNAVRKNAAFISELK